MNKHLTVALVATALIGANAVAQTYDWKAPASASKKGNPVPASAAALAKGKAIYDVQCAVCHGAAGHGDGLAAAALVPKPRNLTESAIQGQSDGAIFWKLTQGRAPMPAFAGVSEEERWSVIHYIRKLGGGSAGGGAAPKPAPAPPTAKTAKPEKAMQDFPAKADAEKDAAAPGLIPPNEAPAGYVSRAEYDTLLQRVLDLETRLGGAETKTAEREKEVDESLFELEKKGSATNNLADATRAGTTKFLLAGYGFAGFEDRPGESGKFVAGFNPIFLWKLSDRLFFESELEIGLTPQETELHLEYANLSYLVNGYITAKAGKFLTPFGTFADRYHAAWINKLPDQPLAVGEEGIVPFAQTGVQLSGGFTLGPTKLNYALYAANGPRLNRDADNLADMGRLEFDNFSETNSRSYGGRIGFLPIPELEVGYSFLSVTGPVDARLQAVDLTYIREFGWLQGTLDLRGQWVWSDAGDFRFTPESEEAAEPLPITFANRRDGGYVQAAYRPTKAKSDIIKSFELVCRYDRLSLPAAVRLGDDPERLTIGLNYWLGPSTVLKAAYQFNLSDTDGNGGRDGNSLLFQASMGF